MKAVFAIIGSVCCLAVGLAFLCADAASTPVLAGDMPPGAAAVTTVAGTMPLIGDDSQYQFVGSKKCKMCHMQEYKSWAETKMGKAFETLQPGNAVEAKKKHGLDPEKDYTQDVTCLECHTTGFGLEGGYAVPDPNDKKAMRKAKKLAGVGCESCHGPGSEYVKVHMDIFKSKRTYKVEELYAAGQRKIDATACTSCHNEKSPTIDPGAPFDFEEMKEKGTHEHRPLKQREE